MIHKRVENRSCLPLVLRAASAQCPTAKPLPFLRLVKRNLSGFHRKIKSQLTENPAAFLIRFATARPRSLHPRGTAPRSAYAGIIERAQAVEHLTRLRAEVVLRAEALDDASREAIRGTRRSTRTPVCIADALGDVLCRCPVGSPRTTVTGAFGA